MALQTGSFNYVNPTISIAFSTQRRGAKLRGYQITVVSGGWFSLSITKIIAITKYGVTILLISEYRIVFNYVVAGVSVSVSNNP